MQKSKIEWTDYSWNPIKGICPVDCKLPDGESYCYGRAIYNRFEWMQEDMGEIGYLAEWELEQPIKRKKPTKIFVCSTYELFHSPDKFARDEIFKIIEKCPQHAFQILTKFPQNIDRPMPDNVWLGVSVTGGKDLWRVKELYDHSAKVKFISIEPLLSNLEISIRYSVFENIDWAIIGKLTGFGNEHDPDISWIKDIITLCKLLKVPFFLKNNLKKIWGEDKLIQEFPDES